MNTKSKMPVHSTWTSGFTKMSDRLPAFATRKRKAAESGRKTARRHSRQPLDRQNQRWVKGRRMQLAITYEALRRRARS